MSDTFEITAENRATLEQTPIGRLALARIQELEDRLEVEGARADLLRWTDEQRNLWPAVPARVAAMEQAMSEFERQARDGWHLVDVEMKDGVDEFEQPIWKAYRYLETEAVCR